MENDYSNIYDNSINNKTKRMYEEFLGNERKSIRKKATVNSR